MSTTSELGPIVEYAGGRLLERRPWDVNGENDNKKVRAYYAAKITEARAKAQSHAPDYTAERRRLDALAKETAESIAGAAEQERRERQSRAERRDRHVQILLNDADNEPAMRWVQQVARHEAAHAVYYWLDGAGVDAVGLDFSDSPYRRNGYARCKDSDLQSVHAILAGRAAELIAGYAPRPFAGDPEIAKARRELPSDRRSDADIEREIGRAADVLRKRWWAVEALASEIVLKTDLDGDEAEAVIVRALSGSRAA